MQRGKKWKETLSLREVVWQRSSGLSGTRAHLPDSCYPVFPGDALQYRINQMFLQHHLNDIKCLPVSAHDSEGVLVLAHLFPWRIYPELILLGTTPSFNRTTLVSGYKSPYEKSCPYKGCCQQKGRYILSSLLPMLWQKPRDAFLAGLNHFTL